MPTFLANVIEDILQRDTPLSDHIFILPSKRAGNFLKQEIKNKVNHTILFPEVISIEDFIIELSSIEQLDTTTLLFEFYSIYLNNTAKESQEKFDSFSMWASIALQDFNEIDRHLVDTKYLFDYLKSIDRLENWNIEKGTETLLIKNYLTFFERLEIYYHKLYHHLCSKKLGYQGLQYREAFENLQNYIENSSTRNLVFVGFNALNRSEELIIRELLENEIATIYWDSDQYYFDEHPASVFLNTYKSDWNYFKTHPFNWIGNNFQAKKNIKVIGAPKNITQAKYVGMLLSELSDKQKNYESTAVVLADESLLPVVLSSLPQKIQGVNITMGYELKNMAVTSLFESLFNLHIHAKNSGGDFYYQNIIQLLGSPDLNKISKGSQLIDQIVRSNFIYLSGPRLTMLANQLHQNLDLISFVFENWQNSADIALINCLRLIELLKENTTDKLEREFLYKNYIVLHQLEQLNLNTGYIKDIKTLQKLFSQLIKSEKLSFQGEPLTGLQIMGMLETRVLDFETVIITSVNEGILPAGKSDNSFIPFDVKKDPRIKLPTYHERDAIYSYHFYRLLQRAKNIYLVYNTENDQYGSGEKSRFITELEINNANEVEDYVVGSQVDSRKIVQRNVAKSEPVIAHLHQLAENGLSPTSLTNYINNPTDFYKQKILGIKELEEAEESVAANTLGTVIHKTMESFYKPYIDAILKKEDILSMKHNISAEVSKWFSEIYKNGDISSGKNLLIFEVVQQFVRNFLDRELELISAGHQLKILKLEYDMEAEISIDDLSFPVKLIGQADRIDQLDGRIRVIDYKTGKVERKNLKLNDWSLITNDYKYSKSFQVLFYALLYSKMHGLNIDQVSLESGIISFKNLSSGFMKFNGDRLTSDDLENFTTELKQLITEILNPEHLFEENENKYF